jgi:hypothetical protein
LLIAAVRHDLVLVDDEPVKPGSAGEVANDASPPDGRGAGRSFRQ